MTAREIAVHATRISGMQKLEELYPLISYLQLDPPSRVVELGSARGGTFFAWCQIATAYGVIVSVDTDHSDREAMESYAGPYQRAHFVTADTHDPYTVKQVSDLIGYADLLHIDAGHSEAEVRADWADYNPLVPPGGRVVFHDIDDGGPIGQLFDELAQRHWSIKFVEGRDGWGGIGVLRI